MIFTDHPPAGNLHVAETAVKTRPETPSSDDTTKSPGPAETDRPLPDTPRTARGDTSGRHPDPPSSETHNPNADPSPTAATNREPDTATARTPDHADGDTEPNDPTGRHRSDSNRHTPSAEPRNPNATGTPPASATRCNSSYSPDAPSAVSRRHTPSPDDRQPTGSRSGRPAGINPPATTQPPSTATASAAHVTPDASDARPGTPSATSNADPSADDHTAAPDTRLPVIRNPGGPATNRDTFTADGPPNNSKRAETSRNTPPPSSNHELVRGLPCAPPGLSPTATSRPSRHAAENNTFCLP